MCNKTIEVLFSNIFISFFLLKWKVVDCMHKNYQLCLCGFWGWVVHSKSKGVMILQNWWVFWLLDSSQIQYKNNSFKSLTNIYCTTYRDNINMFPKGSKFDYNFSFLNIMPVAFKQQDDFDNSTTIIQTHGSWMRDYNIATHWEKSGYRTLCVWLWKISFILDIDPCSSCNELLRIFKHMLGLCPCAL